MSTAFETEMGVIPEIAKAVAELDWLLPTDIQSEAIPLILGGGDILMAAETGSGKTGAFCIPVLQIVHETLRKLLNKDQPISSQVSATSKWSMNVYDRGNSMAIDTASGLCQSRDPNGWHGTRATKGVFGKGKYFFEATMTDDGLSRVGWANEMGRLDLGTDSHSFGFGGTGKKSHSKVFDSYGEQFTKGDVIGNFLDLYEGTISWSKNGKHFGVAFILDERKKKETFYPAICLKNAEVCVNFGEMAFKFPVGETKGFQAICRSDVGQVRNSSKSNEAAVNVVPEPNAPLALIIEPSRELAQQTLQQIQKFKKYLADPVPREMLAVGGENVNNQIRTLRSGIDLVVATPGRLQDLIMEKQLSMKSCRFFILDECDGLLESGNENLVSSIHNSIPKVMNDGSRLQTIVCSATLRSFDVKKLANKIMQYPQWIDLKGADTVPETLHHVVCLIDPHKDISFKQLFFAGQHVQTDGIHQRDSLRPTNLSPEMVSEAIKILKGEYLIRAIEKQNMDHAIIFCRTKLDCDNLETYLIQRGGGGNKYNNKRFSCVCLHSDRNPAERQANLEAFKSKKAKFLICTDVAARGLDISGLPYVINFTMPDNKENYVHRVGRVGRAERMGLAISFVGIAKEKVWYHSNCKNRGRGCYNTDLVDHGGCAIWYDEVKLLSEVEEHLGVTIDQVDSNLYVPSNEFDGKVVYGQKQAATGSTYKGHVDILAPAARELARMETLSQEKYLKMLYRNV